MIEEHLALPFETTMLGVLVKVVALDVRGDNDIVAICTRGRERQSVPILDLPLPSPRPVGAEWTHETFEAVLRNTHGRKVAFWRRLGARDGRSDLRRGFVISFQRTRILPLIGEWNPREATTMGQVTIYLDDETEKSVRDAAESNGVSVSKWIAQRIRKDARTEWPTSVRELAGAWQDLPSAEQIRRHSAKDVKRGRL
jgi:hypothetical protein